ncbi:DMT family transporter [Paenibacillus sp. alder61]|uniref:DMT family transporter n=1 Tax=Paenibacillus sp. alder61 TaxID=2862948 RepID=UPI001CD73E58|nr:DMT family transporter [Paenibacillus sp. alder61]MCA1295287.1 DMT family transporter [Paenibacillus sp. alder61]
MSGRRRTTTAHTAALLTILIWGTTFISTKLMLGDFLPQEILLFRFLIGYAVLWAIYPKVISLRPIREELLFAAAGLTGVTLYFLLENIALTYTLASNVGIIVSAAPLITAVLAHFLLGEKSLHLRFLAGFAVAMAGIVMISFNGASQLALNPLGDVLAFLSSVIWGIYSILMRKISSLGIPAIGCTRRVFFYGLVFMLPVCFSPGFHLGLSRFQDSTQLFNLLFLGLGASALCFVTWNWSVGVLGAVRTSTYIFLVPAVTVIASFSILHEPITVITALGMILTLAGLLLSDRSIHLFGFKRYKGKSREAHRSLDELG